jgi:Tat protein translocase TatC
MNIGLDDTKYTLLEHLTELRMRLLKSLLAVMATTSVALFFSSDILDYSIKPLNDVLSDRSRVETILLHVEGEAADRLEKGLEDSKLVHFRGRVANLGEIAPLAKAAIAERRPIDLILVDTNAIGADGALVSDVLEGLDPQPSVVYLVKSAQDPLVADLQLEGAAVVIDPPRPVVLERLVRRAASAAGKSYGAQKLVVLSPLDPFFAYLKVGLVVGLFLACPIWIFQIWQFVAPGLYRREKQMVVPLVVSASALFIGGGLFAYYVMFPIMFDVLVNQMMPASLEGTFTVDNYLSILFQMTLAFGVVFETPLIIAMLAAVGVVTAEGLRRWRKYAIVLSFVIGAVLTPADPISQTLMSVPLVIFYELGILAAVVVGKKRAAAAEAEPVTASGA